MSILTPVVIKHSKVAHSNPILYDSGSATCEFFPPGQTFFGRQIVPASNVWSDGTPSFMAPISHYHLLQTEKFLVESGEGYWYMKGQKVHLKAGQEIVIPRWVAHRFENIPGGKEPLSILYRYDAQMYEMERRFFCNMLTYLDDCRLQKTPPSLCQIAMFLTACWMPAELFPVPGYLGCLLNTLAMWTLAVIGKVVYGYQSSYLEYYDPSVLVKAKKAE